MLLFRLWQIMKEQWILTRPCLSFTGYSLDSTKVVNMITCQLQKTDFADGYPSRGYSRGNLEESVFVILTSRKQSTLTEMTFKFFKSCSLHTRLEEYVMTSL